MATRSIVLTFENTSPKRVAAIAEALYTLTDDTRGCLYVSGFTASQMQRLLPDWPYATREEEAVLDRLHTL
jgi:hypothetical protein